MPFFGTEPFDTAEATYVWAGVGQPGFFRVTVSGQAPKFSGGFQLKRDADFVGGLAVVVTGWSGPLLDPPSAQSYTVTGVFNGTFLPEIVVIGSNKTETVHVTELPFMGEEEVMKHLRPA